MTHFVIPTDNSGICYVGTFEECCQWQFEHDVLHGTQIVPV